MTLDINILKRFFEGKYSRKDYLVIREKLVSADDDRQIRELMLSHWVELDGIRLPDDNVDHILHRLQHQIRLEENKEARRFRFVLYFQRIAAILIIPVILSFLAYLYLQPKQPVLTEAIAEIQCPLGVRTNFTLPDGTTGYLNSGSTLSYPVAFNKTRKVSLTGEAYFDVVHNEKSPFIVKTRELNVRVLGTTFNVISYPGEATEEIILQTGKVKVLDNAGKTLTELNPDQRLIVNHEDLTAKRSTVIASQYTSWTEGKLVFRNEDMKQVAQRLSRWYNAEIVLADKSLEEFTFYATFMDEPLDEVLKLLAMTTPIAYSEEKREAASDGLYPKRKIIISINPKKINQFR
jgi:ferric-dicitrate binding protein FerR (iron transport regulator)